MCRSRRYLHRRSAACKAGSGGLGRAEHGAVAAVGARAVARDFARLARLRVREIDWAARRGASGSAALRVRLVGGRALFLAPRGSADRQARLLRVGSRDASLWRGRVALASCAPAAHVLAGPGRSAGAWRVHAARGGVKARTQHRWNAGKQRVSGGGGCGGGAKRARPGRCRRSRADASSCGAAHCRDDASGSRGHGSGLGAQLCVNGTDKERTRRVGHFCLLRCRLCASRGRHHGPRTRLALPPSP